ncbi:MAG: tellurite resistance TerB C-terminal domain-containing protein, partial [Ruminobacter sp.]|nr:tellurite resistance TerB C-terminal domain-containing protein [Ruminobacter sp.]
PLNKLSKDLQAIIKKISSLDEFTFEEFEKICKEHKIMANGAIDTINSWAYEEFDAPLLEIDTPMFFDKELLENLEIK